MKKPAKKCSKMVKKLQREESKEHMKNVLTYLRILRDKLEEKDVKLAG